MEKNIVEGNKLIAEFMGGALVYLGELANIEFQRSATLFEYIPIERLQYHSSWDLLMPVVDKIEAIDLFENGVGYHFKYHFTISAIFVEISLAHDCKEGKHGKLIWHFVRQEKLSKIEATWLTVVEFIEARKHGKDESPKTQLYGKSTQTN